MIHFDVDLNGNFDTKLVESLSYFAISILAKKPRPDLEDSHNVYSLKKSSISFLYGPHLLRFETIGHNFLLKNVGTLFKTNSITLQTGY